MDKKWKEWEDDIATVCILIPCIIVYLMFVFGG
ncbi:hypothetical protein LCGC14_1049770 [marine sediment metagenome]|uniref:Uncharacterized protein n=1 Tax=marine sediment metagenome TaxID=412755 RepID=A0A0F9QV70_9ZZZZ